MGNSIEVHITTTSRSLNQLGVRNPPVARNTMKFDCEKSVSIICEKTVRYSFVSHLSAALTRERISVSVSDGDVQNQTVNDWAAVSVVVFSDMKKPWFIERIDNNGHPVVSVIYGVDPYPLDRGFDLVREFLKARNLLAQETCGIFMQDNDSDLPGYYQKRKVVVKSLEEVTEDELDGFEMVDDDDEEEEDDDVELDGFELNGFAPAGVGYGNVTEEMMEKKRVSKSGRAYHSHFVLPCFGRILVVVYRLCSTS